MCISVYAYMCVYTQIYTYVYFRTSLLTVFYACNTLSTEIYMAEFLTSFKVFAHMLPAQRDSSYPLGLKLLFPLPQLFLSLYPAIFLRYYKIYLFIPCINYCAFPHWIVNPMWLGFSFYCFYSLMHYKL